MQSKRAMNKRKNQDTKIGPVVETCENQRNIFIHKNQPVNSSKVGTKWKNMTVKQYMLL